MLIFETTHVAVEGSFSSVILPTMYRDGRGVHSDLDYHLVLTSTRTAQERASGQLCSVGTGSWILLQNPLLNRRRTAFSVINFLMMFFAPVSAHNMAAISGCINQGGDPAQRELSYSMQMSNIYPSLLLPVAYPLAPQAASRGAQRTLHPRPAEPAESRSARSPD